MVQQEVFPRWCISYPFTKKPPRSGGEFKNNTPVSGLRPTGCSWNPNRDWNNRTLFGVDSNPGWLWQLWRTFRGWHWSLYRHRNSEPGIEWPRLWYWPNLWDWARFWCRATLAKFHFMPAIFQFNRFRTLRGALFFPRIQGRRSHQGINFFRGALGNV